MHLLIPSILLLFFLFPSQGGATQIHSAEEGPLVHQIGHFLFIVSMGILVYWLRKRGLTKVAGWRHIQYSAIFFILWNADAIFVHTLDDSEGIFEKVVTGGWSHWIRPVGDNYGITLLYYFGRMDHLLCVPAIVFLYLGLKNLLKDPGSLEAGEGRP